MPVAVGIDGIHSPALAVPGRPVEFYPWFLGGAARHRGGTLVRLSHWGGLRFDSEQAALEFVDAVNERYAYYWLLSGGTKDTFPNPWMVSDADARQVLSEIARYEVLRSEGGRSSAGASDPLRYYKALARNDWSNLDDAEVALLVRSCCRQSPNEPARDSHRDEPREEPTGAPGETLCPDIYLADVEVAPPTMPSWLESSVGRASAPAFLLLYIAHELQHPTLLFPALLLFGIDLCLLLLLWWRAEHSERCAGTLSVGVDGIRLELLRGGRVTDVHCWPFLSEPDVLFEGTNVEVYGDGPSQSFDVDSLAQARALSAAIARRRALFERWKGSSLQTCSEGSSVPAYRASARPADKQSLVDRARYAAVAFGDWSALSAADAERLRNGCAGTT
ncbi:MAG: hypothetical protein AAF411_20570 [Myxococcota bacterium]